MGIGAEMERKLTISQEKFAQEYVLTGNASEAYRRAYPKSCRWKEEIVHQKASRMLKHGKVAARIKGFQDEAAKRNEVTVDSLAAEYNEVIKEAHKAGQFSPVVAAITKKGELFGLFKKHQEQGKTEITLSLADELRNMDRLKE